jgi:hypothetical protein
MGTISAFFSIVLGIKDHPSAMKAEETTGF